MLCPVQEDQEGSIKSTSGSDRSWKALLQVIQNNIFQFSILVHSPRPTNNLKISQDILNQNCSKIQREIAKQNPLLKKTCTFCSTVALEANNFVAMALALLVRERLSLLQVLAYRRTFGPIDYGPQPFDCKAEVALRTQHRLRGPDLHPEAECEHRGAPFTTVLDREN